MTQALNISQPSSHVPSGFLTCKNALHLDGVASADDEAYGGSSHTVPSPSKSHALAKNNDRFHSEATFVIAQTTGDRVDALRAQAISVAPQASLVIAEMLRCTPRHGMTEPQQRAEAFAVCMHLNELDDYDVWCDGRHTSSRHIPAGTVHISDMRRSWQADIRSPFHVVNFYISQSVLDEIASEQGKSRVEQLTCPIWPLLTWHITN
jgi:hypothetical protein